MYLQNIATHSQINFNLFYSIKIKYLLSVLIVKHCNSVTNKSIVCVDNETLLFQIQVSIEISSKNYSEFIIVRAVSLLIGWWVYCEGCVSVVKPVTLH